MKVLKATKDHLQELAQLERWYMEHHVALDDYFAFKENMTEMWLKHAQSQQANTIVLYLTNQILLKQSPQRNSRS